MARSTATAPVLAAVPNAPAPATGMAALCDALDASFPERKSVIRAVARALLAGENVFILGEPGTGKSLLVRCFSQALGLSYWEHLMGRFTAPEELFGPFSIPELQKGRFTRAFQGYMPGAQVAFLDEIWKANAGVLNSLLTITNEHIFHDDGKALPVPLVSLVTASNELPESESELAAIYDRCAVRLVTQYVEDRDAFKRLVFSPTPTVPSVAIDFVAEQTACRAVTVPADVQDALVSLRYKIRDAGFKVSDRKWRQVVGLLRAAAHLEGRTACTVEDLEVLEDVLWRAPEEKTAITRIIQEISNPNGAKAVADLDAARELAKNLPVIDPKDSATAVTFLSKVRGVNSDLSAIAKRMLSYGDSRKVVECRDAVKAIRAHVVALANQASGADQEI